MKLEEKKSTESMDKDIRIRAIAMHKVIAENAKKHWLSHPRELEDLRK